MDSQTLGLVGGIIGGLLGVMGGIIGTYFSIKNTKGPQERALAIRFSTIIWGAMIPVGILAYLLPSYYKFLAFMPIWIALPFLIRYWNKKQQEARIREADTQSAQS